MLAQSGMPSAASRKVPAWPGSKGVACGVLKHASHESETAARADGLPLRHYLEAQPGGLASVRRTVASSGKK